MVVGMFVDDDVCIIGVVLSVDLKLETDSVVGEQVTCGQAHLS